MKKLVFIIPFLSTLAVAVNSYASVDKLCAKPIMEQCMKEEQSKPDYTRGGANALEFCAAQSVIVCER